MDDLEQKFLEAYENFADGIFRHCYFRIFDREKAKDMMQDTFTKTWAYMADKGEIENLKAFLYKVANNLIIDYSRKKKESSLEKMMQDGFNPGFDSRGNLEDALHAKEIIKIMDKLGEDYREVIKMRHLDDMSVKDIARVLGESENAVSVRIHRGLARLRELINSQ